MTDFYWYSIGTMIAIGLGLMAVLRISTLEKKYVKLVIKTYELEANIQSTQDLVYRSMSRPVSYKGEPVTPDMKFDAQWFEIEDEK